MGARELPVLNFAPFRKYPTKRDHQEFSDEREVCNHCVSGACCSNQDAIALSSFDVFRLAAFFNMAPADFMLTFTQDEFASDGDGAFRRDWNNNPKSSVVTWLRRRENSPSSPCIFLKYVRDPDGTPHRICSVHDARPLSCREYYFTHCKSRGTGELASLLAEGFEKIRDGELTEERVDAELARLGAPNFNSSTLAKSFEYGFWVEMKCALNMDEANLEGSNSYKMVDYQDPIDEKLNRVLSTKYLRSEESYGWKPRDEQLMPYSAGLSFAGSSEYKRIMRIVQAPPSLGLFALGNYPYYVGIRTMVPGVRHSDLFPAIPKIEINTFLSSLPHTVLFPRHAVIDVRSITQRDLYAAVLRALNYLIRFASHIVSLEPILGRDPPGTIETDFFNMVTELETSLNPYIANNPNFKSIRHRMARAAINLLETKLAAATTAEDVFDCLRSLSVLVRTKCSLPPGLQVPLDEIRRTIDRRLQRDKLELYVSGDNPIEARRMTGKRLGMVEAHQAWGAWYAQVLDMRHASLAGFQSIDLQTFYRQTVGDLEKLPFRQNYAGCLFDLITYLSQSMTSNQSVSYRDMPYKDAAQKLASYGIRLFNWLDEKDDLRNDCETLAQFLVAVYKGLGLAYNEDENFGLIVYRLLQCQLPDGSWKTDLRGEEAPDDQAEYLEKMYQATWACINALRPMQHDRLNPANVVLDLV